jgi:hypothetical protein
MKGIKPYVRPDRLASIVSRLEPGGACDLTVTRVDAIGALADTEKDRLRFFRNDALFVPGWMNAVPIHGLLTAAWPRRNCAMNATNSQRCSTVNASAKDGIGVPSMPVTSTR